MDRIKALRDFLATDPHDAFTRFALATEYLKSGDKGQARAFFEGLIQDQPEYVGTYYHLGRLYEDLGESGRAIETYRMGIAIASSQKDFHARAELQSALLEAEGDDFDV